MKISNLFIDKYKIFTQFNIDFTFNSKPLPVVVIAGINGSGKTTLLEFIHYFFNGEIRSENSFIADEKFKYSLTDVQEYLKEIGVSRTYYYKSGTYENDSAKQIIIEYIDKIIYESDVKSSIAYQTLQDKLSGFFSEFNLQVQFNQLDRKKEIYFKNNSSGKILIDELSSGEKELITKVFPLYISDIKNCIILVDEPESSLHPNWQFEIMNIYRKIAEEKNCQIIIATHSPYIVASVPKEQVRILVKEENQIKVIENFSKSYGKRIDEVLLEIFRIKGLRTPEIENKISQIKNFVFTNQFENQAFTDLFNELEAILGADDNDLVLIKLEILKRKKELKLTTKE